MKTKTTTMRASAIIMVTIIASCTALITNAQDTRYTQSYNAPLRLNPALMGPNTHLKGIVNYRSQWANIDKGFTTYRFSFLYPLIMNDDQGKLDIGLSAVNDKAGAFNTLSISLALSYSLKIADDHRISAGMIGGFGQTALDATSQTFDEQYVLGSFDATNPNNEIVVNESRNYPDLGAGLLWNFDPDDKLNVFAGFAAFHHNKPDESLTGVQSDMPISINVHGGVKIIGDKLDFTPNLRMSKQGGAEEYSVGCYIDYKLNETMKIPFGFWYRYRRQDAFAVMLGFEHEFFLVAYSYDLGSFDLMKAVPGSMTHEITLAYQLNRQEDTSAPMSD